MSKFRPVHSLLGAAVLAISAAASAASVSSLLPLNGQLEDDSAEFQSVDLNNNGLLDFGDSIRGIINFPQVRNLADSSITQLGAGSPNQELAAIFSATVTGKTAGSTPGTFNFTFGPTAGFYAGNASAMALLYVDNTAEFAIGGATCTSALAGGNCESNITDGTLWAVLGLSDADDNAFANGLFDNLSAFAALLPSQAVGQAQLNFSILENYTGRTFGEVSCFPFCGAGGDGFTDIVGSGSFLGKRTLTTPYAFTNDTDFAYALVPEPTSLALAGLALLMLGASATRRKRNI